MKRAATLVRSEQQQVGRESPDSLACGDAMLFLVDRGDRATLTLPVWCGPCSRPHQVNGSWAWPRKNRSAVCSATCLSPSSFAFTHHPTSPSPTPASSRSGDRKAPRHARPTCPGFSAPYAPQPPLNGAGLVHAPPHTGVHRPCSTRHRSCGYRILARDRWASRPRTAARRCRAVMCPRSSVIAGGSRTATERPCHAVFVGTSVPLIRFRVPNARPQTMRTGSPERSMLGHNAVSGPTPANTLDRCAHPAAHRHAIIHPTPLLELCALGGHHLTLLVLERCGAALPARVHEVLSLCGARAALDADLGRLEARPVRLGLPLAPLPQAATHAQHYAHE